MVVYGARTVQLARRRDGSLGFSVRGGREHGTGVFISQVESSSDAQLHGLKVGDEILRVNGLSVKKATHREVVSVIKNSSFVQLRVRDVGLLPVKDYPGAAVAWRTVETIETRIYIGLTGQTTLGCSICKGPPGWPGVFVQSTKEVGLAREVGLRPGDQILQCNGVSFVDIDFAKAVYVLKLAQHLDLTIRRGAAAELFAARSSGYSSNNCTDCSGTESTASSVTAGSCGSPPPIALTSSGSRTHRSTGGVTADDRSGPTGDVRKPINGAVRTRPPLEQPEPAEQLGSQLTIDRNRRWQDIEAEWAQSEQEEREERELDQEEEEETVGVTRLEVGGAGRPPEPPPPPPPGPPPPPPALLRGQGDGSSAEAEPTSTAADCGHSQESAVPPPPPPMMSTSTLIPSYRRLLPMTSEDAAIGEEPRVQQHDQLMEEFKEAHRKMFAHKDDDISSAKPERQGCSPPLHSSPPSGGLKRSKPVHVPKPLPSLAERQVIIESRSEGRQMRQNAAPPPPPPPPPEDGKRVESITIYTTPTLAKLAQTQQPLSKAVSTITSTNGVDGGLVSRGQTGVETESLDSFTLEHPPPAAPKPPPTYFDGAPRRRDVLVSIGAYGDNRPEPSRLQFLGNARRSDTGDESDGGKFERAASQLQHELVQTLSRSNLRHRTGSMDNLMSDSGAATRRTVTDKYGSVLNISDSGADSGPGGGILKNGTARSSNKSISFGKTTMIGDVPVTVL